MALRSRPRVDRGGGASADDIQSGPNGGGRTPRISDHFERIRGPRPALPAESLATLAEAERKDEMAGNKQPQGNKPAPVGEQRGVVTDVVVPLAQAAVGGAVGAVVAGAINKPKDK
jgi:hypothetical protein